LKGSNVCCIRKAAIFCYLSLQACILILSEEIVNLDRDVLKNEQKK
jgi:hypothetical protein